MDTFTEIKLTGNRAYYNVFSTGKVKSTKAEYDALATGKAPVDPLGGIWKSSYEAPEYNTPDGDIHMNEYCNMGNGFIQIWVKTFTAPTTIPIDKITESGTTTKTATVSVAGLTMIVDLRKSFE